MTIENQRPDRAKPKPIRSRWRWVTSVGSLPVPKISPECPHWINPRSWDILYRHATGESYGSIANTYGIKHESAVASTCKRTICRLARPPKPKPPKIELPKRITKIGSIEIPQPLPSRPEWVNERYWGIFTTRINGEKLHSIAGKVGVTRERIRQICLRVAIELSGIDPYRPNRRRFRAVTKIQKLACQYGCPFERPYWVTEEEWSWFKAHLDGYQIASIARTAGTTSGRVHAACRRVLFEPTRTDGVPGVLTSRSRRPRVTRLQYWVHKNGKPTSRPDHVTPKVWEWFNRHIIKGESFRSIASDEGITEQTIAMRCWSVVVKPKPRGRPSPYRESRPDAVDQSETTRSKFKKMLLERFRSRGKNQPKKGT